MDQNPLLPPDTADLDLANQVGQHLKTLQLSVDVDAALELLSGAAYNLAGARIAHGLLRWKAHDDYDTIRSSVANEQWDLFEMAAVDMCLRSLVTALDLCAAALFRLGGGHRSSGETDLRRWDDDVKRTPLSVPARQSEWADLRRSSEYKNLLDSRNDATHRRRQVTAVVGASAALSIDYGGTSRGVLQLTEEISEYGRKQFQDLCAILLTWPRE
ncbi:hypothetical protein [Streptomyces sp. IBSBF 2806]|uniref:hypothetical protein n=1 Tax=Streptomyces sp. IBSBF 2806 TaxID=2903529 RepID=UPI002FDC4474